jgi:hypothetical protein
MTILATSRQPALLDNFLTLYLRDLSGGWENEGSPSTARRAPRCFSLRPVGASQHPDPFVSSGNKSTWSKPPFSWGEPWYTADLVDSLRSGKKESTENGSVGTSKQE